MTLREAQMMAVEGLEEALKDERPKVYVVPFEGILSVTVASHRFQNTPALLVSPIAEDDTKVDLAVYFLASSEDRGQIGILDKSIQAIRDLPGKGRTPLEVAVKSAYDDDALRKGLRIWVLMASWPHLADGSEPVSPFSGPVAEAMKRISQLFPEGVNVAMSEGDRRRFLLGHELPFVTITAAKAEFDKTDARRISAIKEGHRYGIAAKGQARWIIGVRCYAASADEAEGIVWPIVPYIPETVSDEYGFNTSLKVSALETGEELGADFFSVSCTLEVPAYRKPEQIPAIKDAIVFGKED